MTMILLLPVGDLQALISADSLPKQVHHNIEVTASNFKQNFSFFGNASYNQADGVTTLTPNQSCSYTKKMDYFYSVRKMKV